MKIVKAELEDGLHSKFKTWAFTNGTTMAKALVGLIAAEVDYFPVREVEPATKTPPAPVSVAAKANPVEERNKAIASLSGDQELADKLVPMKKCAKCFDQFAVADMVTEPKSGKLFCHDCVENIKNGQA